MAELARRRTFNLRVWLRALHRDAGNLVIGLTVIYAVSGLAVNHVDDWNSNFVEYERVHQLGSGTIPEQDDQRAASHVLAKLGVREPPSDVYRVGDKELEILVGERTFVAHLDSGQVDERGRRSRFFVRLANWLHLNRGKKAWTYVADGYAVLLLLLAFSGMFLLPGKKGLWGRGGVMLLIGAAVPVLYVVLSGGP